MTRKTELDEEEYYADAFANSLIRKPRAERPLLQQNYRKGQHTRQQSSIGAKNPPTPQAGGEALTTSTLSRKEGFQAKAEGPRRERARTC